MAYNTEELYKRSIDLIVKKRIIFFTQLIAHLGIASSTFYVHFPSNSENYKKMHLMIQENKAEIFTAMISKWFLSDSPSLQIALMKIIGNQEIRQILSYQQTHHTGDPINQIQNNQIDVKMLSLETLQELRQAYKETQENGNTLEIPQ